MRFSGGSGGERQMALSRRYCFYSCFVHWYDDLEQELSENVFDCAYSPSHGGHDRIFYSLLNLLWLGGYYPQVSYYRQCHTDFLHPEELAGEAPRYARIFQSEAKAGADAAEKILAYFQGRPKNGLQRRITDYRYAWVFWNINQKTERPVYPWPAPDLSAIDNNRG